MSEPQMKLILCAPADHNYQVVHSGYNKQEGNKTTITEQPIFDRLKSYATLFCTKCGWTKEILCADMYSNMTSKKEE